MKENKQLKFKNSLVLIGLILSMFFINFAFSPLAEARAGSGRSSGFRGSRSVAPRQYSQPQRPSYQQNPYQQAPPSAPRTFPSAPAPAGGGLLRNFGAGMAGGLLGGMLFRGMSGGGGYGPGYGGMGGGGGGIGFFDILVLAILGFVIYRYFISRRASASNNESYSSWGSSTNEPNNVLNTSAYPVETPPQIPYGGSSPQELDQELYRMKDIDPQFESEKFKDQCLDTFFTIQTAWMNRELNPVKDLLGEELFNSLNKDVQDLKTQGLINKIENIVVRQNEIMEAWQELGRSYITLRFYAHLIDYTLDEKSGNITSGNKSQAVKFEEFWTFSRDNSSSSKWKLTAIEQVA